MDISTLLIGLLVVAAIGLIFLPVALLSTWQDAQIKQGNIKAAIGKAVIISICATVILGSIVPELATGTKLTWLEWVLLVYMPLATYIQWQKVKEMKTKKKQTSDD